MGLKFVDLTPQHKKVIISLVKLLAHWGRDEEHSNCIKSTFLHWVYFYPNPHGEVVIAALRLPTSVRDVSTHLVNFYESWRSIRRNPGLRDAYPLPYGFEIDLLGVLNPKRDELSKKLLNDLKRDYAKCVSHN